VRQVRIAVSCLVIAVAAAACGSSGSTTSSSPSNTPPTSSQPSAVSTGSPSESAATVSLSPAGPQAIGLSEWKVVVASSIKSGTTDFTIVNNGANPHELLIFKSDLAPAAYPTDAAGDIQEEGAGVTLVSDGENIDPGGSQARSVDLAPGTYLFLCNIPGHFKEGMFAVVTVTP
jgi:copper binding plastocyanin/azurin family protein